MIALSMSKGCINHALYFAQEHDLNAKAVLYGLLLIKIVYVRLLGTTTEASPYSLGVTAIHYVNDGLCVGVIASPIRTNTCLASQVPHLELHVNEMFKALLAFYAYVAGKGEVIKQFLGSLHSFR
jgi:hypothetical protein